MCAESQAGQRFCGMLTGSAASSSGVPAEHAVALACALRDHLAACSSAPEGAAVAPLQPKKRKQRGTAAAPEQAQVSLAKQRDATSDGVHHLTDACTSVLRSGLPGILGWRIHKQACHLRMQACTAHAACMTAGFRDAGGLGVAAAGAGRALPGPGLGAQPGRAGQCRAGAPPLRTAAAPAAGQERLRGSAQCGAEHRSGPIRLTSRCRHTVQARFTKPMQPIRRLASQMCCSHLLRDCSA